MADKITQTSGETVDKPLVFKGKDVKSGYGLIRTPYLLEQHEFFVLTKSNSDLKDWQKRMLQISIGASLPVLGRVIFFLYTFANLTTEEDRKNIAVPVQGWEVFYLSLAILIFIILTIALRYIKSDKDKLTTKIKDFFEKS